MGEFLVSLPMIQMEAEGHFLLASKGKTAGPLNYKLQLLPRGKRKRKGHAREAGLEHGQQEATRQGRELWRRSKAA